MADSVDTTSIEIPKGFCQCGCGGKTTISPETSTAKGWVRGEPRRFIWGHHNKVNHPPNWNNYRSTNNGYVTIRVLGHPRGGKRGYVTEHTLLAEKALGKALPKGSEVHHHGPIKEQCLVICQDIAYHNLLHVRQRALEYCGNANFRKCTFCKKWDDPSKLVVKYNGVYHRSCKKTYLKEYHRKIKYNLNPMT